MAAIETIGVCLSGSRAVDALVPLVVQSAAPPDPGRWGEDGRGESRRPMFFPVFPRPERIGDESSVEDGTAAGSHDKAFVVIIIEFVSSIRMSVDFEAWGLEVVL